MVNCTHGATTQLLQQQRRLRMYCEDRWALCKQLARRVKEEASQKAKEKRKHQQPNLEVIERFLKISFTVTMLLQRYIRCHDGGQVMGGGHAGGGTHNDTDPSVCA